MLLQDAVRKACDTVDTITGRCTAQRSSPTRTAASLADYLNAFSYDLTDEDLDGIQEFIRFAYYHGVLPDVGDLNIYSPETPDRPNDDDIASR